MTKKHHSRLIPEKLKFIAEIGRTSAWLTQHYTRFLKPYNISTQQLNILRVLRTKKDRVKMNEINELLIVKSPNVTRLVDKLIIQKLVQRDRSEADRRVVYIKITRAGLDMLTDFDKKHEGELSQYMDSFTVEEARQFREILQRITK